MLIEICYFSGLCPLLLWRQLLIPEQEIHRHLFLVFVPLSQKELLPEIIVGGRGEGEAIDKV